MEQEQPVRVGRRLAAIVAADVAGYSRLMGLDEVGTARILREHRKVTDALVAKHGGRLVKTTGDGVRGFFACALLLDPCNVEALVCSAIADHRSVASLFTDDRTARLKEGETSATKALSLAPNHARAHNILGGIYAFTNRVELGIAECERAAALDRNYATAHATIGMAKYFIGRGVETEAHIREALRLSPRDTNAYMWMGFAGTAKLWLGADAEAVAWLRRSIEANRNSPLVHFYLAAALAHLGELGEARATARAGLELHPSFTISRYRASAACNHRAYLAGRERTYESLRKAGVPDG